MGSSRFTFRSLAGRWVPCARVDGDTTNAEVTGLEPGKKYEFRVRAHNEEGDSDPLDGDRAIIAKDPFGGWQAQAASELHREI